MKKIIVLACCFLLLAACTAAPLRNFWVKDYRDEPKIELNVAKVVIQSNIQYGTTEPFIEYHMPLTPLDAIKNWAKNRFVAKNAKSPVVAYITVTRASMTALEKPAQNWYTLDNIVYELNYQVGIRFVAEDKVVSGYTVTGYEKESIPMKSSLADKEETWENMLNRMLKKVDYKITDSIPGYFIKK